MRAVRPLAAGLSARMILAALRPVLAGAPARTIMAALRPVLAGAPARTIMAALRPVLAGAPARTNMPALRPVLIGGFALTILAALSLRPPAAGAAEPVLFDVARIPAELARDADLVVREDIQTFEIQSVKAATHKVRRAVTVMNSKGRDAGVIALPYDRFRKVMTLQGWIVDARGKVIRKLKSSDIEDFSAIQGFSLYADARMKYAELSNDVYPYTLVYDYEMAYDGLLGWPSWWPEDEDGPVERSVFEIHAPADMAVRYQAIGLSVEPRINEEKGRRTWRWSLSNQPKFEMETFGPSFREQAPHLLTGPARFEMDGRAGDMSSWETLGSWFYDLWKEKASLTPEEEARVRDLCADAGSDREKARRLYEYLQSKCRYVSVQLGIGGWQPFDASQVSRLGYGDCKGLTNYMRALLGAAGIEAWPALVMAGEREADVVDVFPGNQFNHVILFVPLPSDTLWLECTSRNSALGELGSFTEDRHTLVIGPAGGHLVRTPASSAADNQLARRASVDLGPAGEASAVITTRYSGNQQGYVRRRLASATPRQRDEWLSREIDLPNFTVRQADFSGLEKKSTELTLSATIDVPSLATASGPRLFVRPNLINRWTLRLPNTSTRKHSIRFSYASIDGDTIAWQVPPNYMVESAPRDVKIENAFGSYESFVRVDGARIEYRRRMELKQRSIDVSAYPEFRQFLDEVVRADEAKVVLVRKT